MSKQLREIIQKDTHEADLTRVQLAEALRMSRSQECGISLQEISEIIKNNLSLEEIDMIIKNLE